MKPMRVIILLALPVLLAGCASAPVGETVSAPVLRAGDTWTWRVINNYNDLPLRTETMTVTAVDGERAKVEIRSGEKLQKLELAGLNPVDAPMPPDYPRATYASPLPAFEFPMGAGQSWNLSTTAVTADGAKGIPVTVQARVTGREAVQVPAGSFETLRIRRNTFVGDSDGFKTGTTVREVLWYAPAVRQFVKRTWQWDYIITAHSSPGSPYEVKSDFERHELESFTPGR